MILLHQLLIIKKSSPNFPYFQDFLDFHDLTEDEFWKIADKWRNEKIWHKVNNEWRLRNELK